MTRLRSTAAVWLALGAIGFGALWPLLAYLSPSARVLMAEVCSVNGGYHVDLGGRGSGQQDPSTRVPHCAFCTLGADRLTSSKPDQLVLAGPVELLRIRRLNPELPPPAFLLQSAARPRAPPASS